LLLDLPAVAMRATHEKALAKDRAPRRSSAFAACFLRELRAALLNRFVYLYSAAMLATGVGALTGEYSGETSPYFLLQAVLYLVPLFALLIGTGSAQNDQEERVFLLTQPIPRWSIVLGKFVALWSLLSLAAGLLLVPSAFGDTALELLAVLWGNAIGISGVFLALGLAVGFSTNDRVKAHLAALCGWLVLLAGFDLVALTSVHLTSASLHQCVLVFALMVNPLDALRVGALFSLDQVLFDASQAPLLARWWIAHPEIWVAIICVLWIAVALAWSTLRVEREEF
jgi:ABC-type transport system involved in multi-copper enzyme maturation permease subunit